MLVLIFFFGCFSQTESKDTDALPNKETEFFKRKSRYILPVGEDFPQSVVEILQSCNKSICYVDEFVPTKKIISEDSDTHGYYFLHSGNFALLIESNDNRALPKSPVLNWYRVNGILSYCIGDPLQYIRIGLNIDREISIERIDNRYKWVINFNGNNTCELNGVLKIGIFDQSIDTSGLIVNLKPWTKGGSVYLHEKMLHLGIETLEGK